MADLAGPALRQALADASRAATAAQMAAHALELAADRAHDLDALHHAQDIADRCRLAATHLDDIALRHETRVTTAALSSGRVRTNAERRASWVGLDRGRC